MTIRRMLAAMTLAFAASALFAAAPFSGSYAANGKDAKLAYLTALKGEPFSGHPVTVLVFSEKDASKDKNPGFHAQMGDFGDALVVHLSQDGAEWNIIGTEFAHAALKHSGASGSGILHASDIKLADGELSGRIASGPGSDLFGEPLSVDLKFQVKMP